MNERHLSFLSWVGAGIGACVAITAFAFQNFETKEESKFKLEGVEKRLERIENKLDQMNGRLFK